MDVFFASIQEYQFLQDILIAVKNGDVETFTNRVVNFD